MELFRLHNAERAIGCPGSLSLTPRVIIDIEPTQSMLEGRAADWLIQRLICADPISVGETSPHGVRVDDEMMDAVRLYFNTIQQYTGEEPNALFSEFECHLSWLTDEYRRHSANPEDWFKDRAGRYWRTTSGCTIHRTWGVMGRADYRHLNGTARHLTVLDFKYGHSTVEAENNAQLIGACLDELTLRQIDTATLIIVSPRSRDGIHVKVWDVDAAMIDYWRQKFIYAVWEANQPNAPLRTGNWCKTCNAAGLCPAFEEKLNMLKTILDAPSAMTPLEVGEKLSLARELSETADTMKTVLGRQALHMLKNGENVAGHKLVRSITRRKLIDGAADTLSMYGDLYGVTVTENKPLGLGKLEKLLPAEVIEEITEKPPGALEVAPESDKRSAAINTNPEAVFGPANNPE